MLNLRKWMPFGSFSFWVLRVWGNGREHLVLLSSSRFSTDAAHRHLKTCTQTYTYSLPFKGTLSQCFSTYICVMQQNWQVLVVSRRVDVQHKHRQNSNALLMSNKSTPITECQHNHLSLTRPYSMRRSCRVVAPRLHRVSSIVSTHTHTFTRSLPLTLAACPCPSAAPCCQSKHWQCTIITRYKYEMSSWQL